MCHQLIQTSAHAMPLTLPGLTLVRWIFRQSVNASPLPSPLLVFLLRKALRVPHSLANHGPPSVQHHCSVENTTRRCSLVHRVCIRRKDTRPGWSSWSHAPPTLRRRELPPDIAITTSMRGECFVVCHIDCQGRCVADDEYHTVSRCFESEPPTRSVWRPKLTPGAMEQMLRRLSQTPSSQQLGPDHDWKNWWTRVSTNYWP